MKESMQQARIDILMATYNGGQFLAQQLDSIFNQTFTDFKIIVRDDGSTDDTLDILSNYQQLYPNKIVILQDTLKNLGPCQNFGTLMQHSTAPYSAFCDQDDIWLSQKLEKNIALLQAIENEDKQTPCLIFSDMQSIDDNDNLLHSSVWEWLHLHPEYTSLNRLLVQNIPHGCTMLFNKALREITLPLPSEAILHDHWLMLTVSLFGKTRFSRETLVQLRSHTGNVTRNIHTSTKAKLEQKLTNLNSNATYEYYIQIRSNQADALLERYGSKISSKQKHMLEQFVLLKHTKGLKRKRILVQNKFYRTSILLTLKLILRA